MGTKGNKNNARITGDLVQEYLKRFPQVGALTLAKKLVLEHPGVYTDVEHARGTIRYYTGNMGVTNKYNLASTQFVRPSRAINPFDIPGSEAEPWTPFHIPERYNNGLIFSDNHFPYHDVQAHNSMLEYTTGHKKINFILVNGDALDCYQGSRYVKDPRKRSISNEIWLWIEFLNILYSTFPGVKIYWKLGNHCFDSTTEILTSKGWKLGIDLDHTDLVGTLNMKTNEVEYQDPDLIHKMVYAGDMYSYSGNMFDFMVTDRHRMLYKTWEEQKEYVLSPIQDMPLSKGARIKMKHSGINNNPDYNISDNYIKLVAWIMTDGSISHKNNDHDNKPNYSISQSKLYNIERIITILNLLKLEHSISYRQRNITHIQKKKLKKQTLPAAYIQIKRGRTGIKQTGNHLLLDDLIQNKYIFPEWISKLSKRQFDLFVQEFILGDGSVNRISKLSSCVYGRKDVIDALQILCIHNGYRASVYTYRDNQYRLNLTNKQESVIDKAGTRIKITNKADYVWCVSVPNQTIITRRNGKVLITGNCERWENYLKTQAPIVLDMEEFKLSEIIKIRGVEDITVIEKQIIYAGRLPILHGHEFQSKASSPVNPARGLFLKALSSSLVSHSHVTSSHSETDVNGKLMSTFSIGCLADLHPEYALVNRWNHGFAFIETEGLEFSIENMKIYKGKVYRA